MLRPLQARAVSTLGYSQFFHGVNLMFHCGPSGEGATYSIVWLKGSPRVPGYLYALVASNKDTKPKTLPLPIARPTYSPFRAWLQWAYRMEYARPA